MYSSVVGAIGISLRWMNGAADQTLTAETRRERALAPSHIAMMPPMEWPCTDTRERSMHSSSSREASSCREGRDEGEGGRRREERV